MSALPELAVELGAAHAGVLGQVLPEVRDAFPNVPPDDRSVDRSEQRVRIQTALASWRESVASRRPLVIAVDDANAADEPSLAVCAGLSKRVAVRPLGVIVTCTTGEPLLAQRTFEVLRQGATRIALARLGAADTTALVRALFGDADNAGRLGQWLHDRTDGNPSQTIALAAQLIRDGQIRYQDGAWLLHSELSPERLPQGMKDVLERRVARLSDGARGLAEAASILRGRFSIAQCLALTDASSDEVFRWLDELVDEGIVIGVDGEFQLGRRALHTHLSERLDEARRRELHRRAGELLLASEARDAIAEIDAGWHGNRLAFLLGTTFAALRHRLAQRKIEVERFKPYKGMFAPLIGTAAIMIGVAANSFDPESARRFLGAARMMSAFPSEHIVAVMFDHLRYYAYASEGRLCEATAPFDPSSGELAIQQLVLLDGEQPKVIGGLALKLDRDASGPVRRDVLEAIAQSLQQVAG